MKVTQKKIYPFLYFIFLSVMVLAGPVQVDLQLQGDINNTAEDFLSHKGINGTSVKIPSDFLRRTENGEVFFNFGGSEGDDLDNMFKRKPRLYFDGESLWSSNFESSGKFFFDFLDYIEFLLSNPERERTSSQLTSALDELKILNNERHRREAEQQQVIAEVVLESSTLEDGWRFTHHPGYQEHHRAYASIRYRCTRIFSINI